jgi:cell division protein FtsB
MLSTLCPQCSQKLKVPAEAIGRNAKCPNCGREFPVEAPKSMPAANLAPPPLPYPVAKRFRRSTPLSVPLIFCAGLAVCGLAASLGLAGLHQSADKRADIESKRADAADARAAAADFRASAATADAETAGKRATQLEALIANLKKRAADAEEALRLRDAGPVSPNSDSGKQKDTFAGANDLAAKIDRLSRENAGLAQQVTTMKKEKEDDLKKRDLMARGQLGSLSHAEQMEALAIIKKINAHKAITMEENQRLTYFCGGSVARTLLFPQFEQAGEDAINAWADKNSGTTAPKKSRPSKKSSRKPSQGTSSAS